MAAEGSVSPSEGDVLLLVGTMKGAFLFWSDRDRREWRREGPHFPGETVYSLAFDQRGGRHRALAGTQSWHWGSVIRTSDDFGASWSAHDRQTSASRATTSPTTVSSWPPGASRSPASSAPSIRTSG